MTMKRDSFVEREFLVTQGEASTQLTARVYRPTRSRFGEYRCSYDIYMGTKKVRKFTVCGEDSLQALLLALGLIVVEIERLLSKMNGRIDAGHWSDLRRLRPKTV